MAHSTHLHEVDQLEYERANDPLAIQWRMEYERKQKPQTGHSNHHKRSESASPDPIAGILGRRNTMNDFGDDAPLESNAMDDTEQYDHADSEMNVDHGDPDQQDSGVIDDSTEPFIRLKDAHRLRDKDASPIPLVTHKHRVLIPESPSPSTTPPPPLDSFRATGRVPGRHTWSNSRSRSRPRAHSPSSSHAHSRSRSRVAKIHRADKHRPPGEIHQPRHFSLQMLNNDQDLKIAHIAQNNPHFAGRESEMLDRRKKRREEDYNRERKQSDRRSGSSRSQAHRGDLADNGYMAPLDMADPGDQDLCDYQPIACPLYNSPAWDANEEPTPYPEYCFMCDSSQDRKQQEDHQAYLVMLELINDNLAKQEPLQMCMDIQKHYDEQLMPYTTKKWPWYKRSIWKHINEKPSIQMANEDAMNTMTKMMTTIRDGGLFLRDTTSKRETLSSSMALMWLKINDKRTPLMKVLANQRPTKLI